MEKIIRKNYLYNVTFNIFNILTPLITMPYITRVLGSENIGEVAFSSSIAQYFMFIGALGTALYGSREIAYVKNNTVKMKKTFFEILIVKIITTIIAISCYLFFVQVQNQIGKLILYAQGINLVSVLFDISWFFQGVENFKLISTRNIVVKFISICFIFFKVKTSQDIITYILILTVSNLISQVSLWYYLKKYFDKSRIVIENKELYKHFKQILKLFILQIAIQIYAYLDRIMLGYLSTNSEVAFYDLAQKITRMPLTIITSLGAVMIPSISNLFKYEKYEEIKSKINSSLIFSIYLSIPMAFGVYSVSENFILMFLGEEYIQVAKLIMIISPVLIIIPIGNVIGVQLMIPLGKELLVALAPLSGAIINIILNYILIPKYFAIGASLASIVAELSGTIITFYFMRKYFNLKEILKKIYKVFFASLIMGISLIYLDIIFENMALNFVSRVFIGIVIFLSLEFLFKDKLILNFLVKYRRRKH